MRARRREEGVTNGERTVGFACICRVLRGVQSVAGDRHGATVVEVAIVLPILLLLIVGVMEVSFMMWTQLSLNFAVEQAARCGALNTTACNTAAKIQSYAAVQAVGVPGLTAANFTVHQSGAAACGTGAQVTASYDFESMVQGLVPYSLTIKATSCYP